MTLALSHNTINHPDRDWRALIAETGLKTRAAYATASDPLRKQRSQASMTPALHSLMLLPTTSSILSSKQTP